MGIEDFEKKLEKEMTTVENDNHLKKLNMNQIFAAAIEQSVGRKLVISPIAVAEAKQDSIIEMRLDEKGNFVLTVK